MGNPETMSKDAAPVITPVISVVVPVHNEEANIGALVAEIVTSVAPMGAFEVVVVNDGSTDNTPTVLAEAERAMPELVVVNHDGNFGQSAAVLSGVRVASADWIATLDGDGQNDPADIPGLWQRLHQSPRDGSLKMIAGHRRKRHDSWIKLKSSKIANGIRGRLLGDGIPDTGCGLKLIEREMFLSLPFFDHFHRFLPALVQRAGGRVISIEVHHRPRGGGQSHYGIGNRLWVGIVDIIGVRWLQRRGHHPKIRDIISSDKESKDDR